MVMSIHYITLHYRHGFWLVGCWPINGVIIEFLIDNSSSVPDSYFASLKLLLFSFQLISSNL